MNTKILRSFIIILGFLLSMFFPAILKAIFNISGDKIFIVSLGYPFTIIIITLTLYFLYKHKIFDSIVELGLKKGFVKGFLFGLIAASPMLISSAIFFKLSDNIFSYTVLIGVIIGPFMEELLFRGYLFGQLFKREKWGFVPAALLAAIFFGAGHLYQGNTLASLAGVFMFTFTGSLWNSWLYIENDNNLWVPIWLHVFMNMSWIVFQTDVPGAAGNNITNIFRIVTITITVIYTIRHSKKNGFKINRKNLFRVAG